MSYLNPYSQINSSPSKAMYSFSKSSRPSMAKKSYCDTFYNIPETKSSRKASIGYGKKVDWDDLNKSIQNVPSPSTYNPEDFVDFNKSHKKGFSVGLGREVQFNQQGKELKNQSFIQFDKCIPGPQRYTVEAPKEGPKYTLRPKTASEVFVTKNSKIVPGPGRYAPVDSINPEGKYCISKWESSRAKKFNPKSSSRFTQPKIQVPGPGNYTPQNSIWLQNGQMTQSKYTSSGNRVFGTGNRSTIFQDEPKKFKNIPGPGMYQSFSDFGSLKVFTEKSFHKTPRPASSRFYKK